MTRNPAPARKINSITTSTHLYNIFIIYIPPIFLSISLTKKQELIHNFNSYLRKNFTAIAKDNTIPFTEELEHTRAYLAVESVRFEDKLFVEYDTPYTNFRLPPLTLQPIVENAFKHGMLSKHKKIQVIIHAYREQERLFFTVKDNGDGLSKTQENIFQKNGILRRKERTGVGIGNVMERLKLLYGERASFEIFNREGGGCEVRISVPFEYNEPMSPEMDILDELALLDKGNLNNDKVLESD